MQENVSWESDPPPSQGRIYICNVAKGAAYLFDLVLLDMHARLAANTKRVHGERGKKKENENNERCPLLSWRQGP